MDSQQPKAPDPQTQPQPQQTQQQGMATQKDDPGKTLGILSIVFAFLFSIVGLILGIVGLNQSKKAGYKNNTAIVGIILSAIMIVVLPLFIMIIFISGSVLQKCSELGPGTHFIDGVKYECYQ